MREVFFLAAGKSAEFTRTLPLCSANGKDRGVRRCPVMTTSLPLTPMER